MTPPVLDMTEDDVQEALNGNEGLFGQLVQGNRKMLVAVLQRHGTSQNDTEDCIQHACIKLWQEREKVKPSHPVVFSWLCTTALNKAKDIYRKTDRIELVGDNAALYNMMDSVENALPDERSIPNLHATIAKLEEPFRSIILMQLAGRSYKQMAQEHGCPIGTIMSRRSKAMNMLREEYQKYL